MSGSKSEISLAIVQELKELFEELQLQSYNKVENVSFDENPFVHFEMVSIADYVASFINDPLVVGVDGKKIPKKSECPKCILKYEPKTIAKQITHHFLQAYIDAFLAKAIGLKDNILLQLKVQFKRSKFSESAMSYFIDNYIRIYGDYVFAKHTETASCGYLVSIALQYLLNKIMIDNNVFETSVIEGHTFSAKDRKDDAHVILRINDIYYDPWNDRVFSVSELSSENIGFGHCLQASKLEKYDLWKFQTKRYSIFKECSNPQLKAAMQMIHDACEPVLGPMLEQMGTMLNSAIENTLMTISRVAQPYRAQYTFANETKGDADNLVEFKKMIQKHSKDQTQLLPIQVRGNLLHQMCLNQETAAEFVGALLEQGYDPNAKAGSYTAVDLAVSAGRTDLIHLFIQNKKKAVLLETWKQAKLMYSMLAIDKENTEIIRQLVEGQIAVHLLLKRKEFAISLSENFSEDSIHKMLSSSAESIEMILLTVPIKENKTLWELLNDAQKEKLMFVIMATPDYMEKCEKVAINHPQVLAFVESKLKVLRKDGSNTDIADISTTSTPTILNVAPVATKTASALHQVLAGIASIRQYIEADKADTKDVDSKQGIENYKCTFLAMSKNLGQFSEEERKNILVALTELRAKANELGSSHKGTKQAIDACCVAFGLSVDAEPTKAKKKKAKAKH